MATAAACGGSDESSETTAAPSTAQASTELATTTAIITHNAPVASIADRRIVVADGLVITNETGFEKKNPEDLSW